MVTVVEKKGHTPSSVQFKMLVLSNGEKIGTVGGGALEYAAETLAPELIKNQKSMLKKYILNPDNEIVDGEQLAMECGGETVLFYEYIGSGEKVNIFGAGHIGKKVAYYLKNLDYNVNIFDCRDDMLEEVDSIWVNNKFLSDYSDLEKYKEQLENSFIIIATHSHDFDYKLLKAIYEIGAEPSYLGLIASRRKSKVIIENLQNEVENADLDFLFSPMGLDIGGRTPDEIAISIISEIQTIRYNKTGHKHMRDK